MAVGADAVAAPAQADDDRMARVEEMIEMLMADYLALHGQLVEEKSAQARALLDSVPLQRNMKKVVKRKEKVAWVVNSRARQAGK